MTITVQESIDIQIAAMKAAGYCDKGIEEWLKDRAHSSVEDSIGPNWSEPWGCCFGECDTPFSVAFREYHGLEEAYQEEKRLRKLEEKRSWKSRSRRPSMKALGTRGVTESFNLDKKNPQKLPRYLRKRLKYIQKEMKKMRNIDL